jgi:hypothetical protein
MTRRLLDPDLWAAGVAARYQREQRRVNGGLKQQVVDGVIAGKRI